MTPTEPLVAVVTPVYNGEKYLAECIESVLAQTYRNWEYTIVNNCSTDRTLEIALSYATRDEQIKVVNNRHFVGIIENHNIAFGLISPQSKYCKVVAGDDWIYPECVAKLVELAERNPTVGIVDSYVIRAHGVRSLGLPHDTSVFSGREVCRLYLLGVIGAFGLPSAVLYRSELVRSRTYFFPGSAPSGDLAACLMSLQATDFALVHQILCFERFRSEGTSTRSREFNGFLLDRIELLERYGPVYLNTEELADRREELLREYYRYLAASLLHSRSNDFWLYHKRRIAQIGYRFHYKRFAKAIAAKLLDLLLNPKQTIEKILGHLTETREVQSTVIRDGN